MNVGFQVFFVDKYGMCILCGNCVNLLYFILFLCLGFLIVFLVFSLMGCAWVALASTTITKNGGYFLLTFSSVINE